jgi:hypothetical protein
MIGKSPVGEWQLALPDTPAMRARFNGDATDKIEEIVLVITYSVNHVGHRDVLIHEPDGANEDALAAGLAARFFAVPQCCTRATTRASSKAPLSSKRLPMSWAWKRHRGLRARKLL